ncbi:(d)CMP kinase [Thermus sp.]|uniref:(d)CMP kinase n=1 Tax=Thermus sp. TaxID=275 RepID=UPI00262EECCC|nr:(d)CMP kinase [Thermus sp.]MCS7216278.1 (d)CMP kinase [Candidatus Bipolaricaulota bacterium]MCX7850253.1 (d)CMP kinase [Thermus sp.]MDW8151508.1 (d)CMP kinase [Candidatus Bipolaricaulota bacterium]
MKIAIDGPAASGKTTLGKRLAQALGFLFVPTGAMYRAAALAHRRGLPLEAVDIRVTEEGRILLNGEDVTADLASPELDELSSQLAVDGAVRARLVELQRRLAQGRDVVMEGRDIGTVVLPDAELKIFLWATLEERARRRQREQGGDFAEVLAALRRRDERDSTRALAPLRPAPDAVFLDTTGKSPDEVLCLVLKLVEERRAHLAERAHP